MIERFPKVEKLKFPPRGGKHERRSMGVHLRILNQSQPQKPIPPSLKAVEFLIDNLHINVDKSVFDLNLHKIWYAVNIYEDKYNKEAKPGVPACKIASKKSDLFEKYKNETICAGFYRAVRRIVVFMVLKKLKYNMENINAEMCRLLDLADPIRLMIKDEPHSEKKHEQGRFREIWVVSVYDEMADKVYLILDKFCIASHSTLPMKAGLALGTPVGNKEILSFLSQVEETGAKSTDVSHWDLLYPAELYRHAVLARYGLYNRDEVEGLYSDDYFSDNWYWAGLRMMSIIHMNKTIAFSDGYVYEQVVAGFGPSGHAGTTNQNNFGRMLAHSEACVTRGIPSLKCMVYGDDCVSQYIGQEEDEILEKMGIFVKTDETIVSKDTIEFCSRLYKMCPDRKHYTVTHKGVNKMLAAWVTKDPYDEGLLNDLGREVPKNVYDFVLGVVEWAGGGPLKTTK